MGVCVVCDRDGRQMRLFLRYRLFTYMFKNLTRHAFLAYSRFSICWQLHTHTHTLWFHSCRFHGDVILHSATISRLIFIKGFFSLSNDWSVSLHSLLLIKRFTGSCITRTSKYIRVIRPLLNVRSVNFSRESFPFERIYTAYSFESPRWWQDG